MSDIINLFSDDSEPMVPAFAKLHKLFDTELNKAVSNFPGTLMNVVDVITVIDTDDGGFYQIVNFGSIATPLLVGIKFSKLARIKVQSTGFFLKFFPNKISLNFLLPSDFFRLELMDAFDLQKLI